MFCLYKQKVKLFIFLQMYYLPPFSIYKIENFSYSKSLFIFYISYLYFL